jgi:hypothetical protein
LGANASKSGRKIDDDEEEVEEEVEAVVADHVALIDSIRVACKCVCVSVCV